MVFPWFKEAMWNQCFLHTPAQLRLFYRAILKDPLNSVSSMYCLIFLI